MMIEQHIEALIFASEKPVTKKEIKECLKATFEWEVSDEDFDKAIENLTEKFRADVFSFQLTQTGGGYEFMTKKDFAPLINTFLNQKAKKRLTRAALETLSIIAYKQPITKAEIEQIRGVNTDYTVQKLLEKELIVIAGRAEGPGHPLTYATSEQFMDYFGINSPADLPKLREIEAAHANEIGEAPAVEELHNDTEAAPEAPADDAAAGDEFTAQEDHALSEEPTAADEVVAETESPEDVVEPAPDENETRDNTREEEELKKRKAALASLNKETQRNDATDHDSGNQTLRLEAGDDGEVFN